MKISRDSKCPLCGSGMTTFLHPLSSSGASLPPHNQRCNNDACELPVRLWAEISVMKHDGRTIAELWLSRDGDNAGEMFLWSKEPENSSGMFIGGTRSERKRVTWFIPFDAIPPGTCKKVRLVCDD